jgi:diacylglycerol kinase family enzyme
VNPNARRSPDSVERAIERARPPGTQATILVTAAPGDGARLAASVRDDVDLVVAVGGDGTVSEVASGLVGSSVPLGIVPAGSTNIVAREHGIPSGLTAAVRLLFGPHRIAVRDLGRCGDRIFLHMAGAGLDARFFQRTNQQLKRYVGWLAYVPAAALALTEPPAEMVVIADDTTVEAETPLVIVANGASVVHPAIRLHPAIRSDDGWLDVLIFKGTDPTAVARTLVKFGVGSARRLTRVGRAPSAQGDDQCGFRRAGPVGWRLSRHDTRHHRPPSGGDQARGPIGWGVNDGTSIRRGQPPR